jgi:ubiquitin-conjugating enzyme E2 H
MSDHEVTLVNDSMQEFFVRFHGPAESESLSHQSNGLG